MCLAIPALVTSADDQVAQVEVSGVARSVSIVLTPGIKAGDYVLVHAGYAIAVVDEVEALETLNLLAELVGSTE